MKKILFAICFLISVKTYSQDLSGINVNLTLTAGNWAFIVGTIQSQDSLTIVYLNRLRDTMQLADPPNFNTNVRFNSIPAKMVYSIYIKVKSLPSTLYDQVGTNISTQIKAIVNTPLQTALTAYDNMALSEFQDTRRRGKNFLSDN